MTDLVQSKDREKLSLFIRIPYTPISQLITWMMNIYIADINVAYFDHCKTSSPKGVNR